MVGILAALERRDRTGAGAHLDIALTESAIPFMLESITYYQEHGALMPTWQSTMHLYPVNGKVNRVGENETAFGHRDAVWSEVIVGVDPDPANRDKITEWARDYYDDLHPFGSGGAYMNFMMEEGEDRIRATYRGNYARLAAVKAKYDPENFFRVNRNIRPAEKSDGAATR